MGPWLYISFTYNKSCRVHSSQNITLLQFGSVPESSTRRLDLIVAVSLGWWIVLNDFRPNSNLKCVGKWNKISKKKNKNKKKEIHFPMMLLIKGNGNSFWSSTQFYDPTYGKERTFLFLVSKIKHSESFTALPMKYFGRPNWG